MDKNKITPVGDRYLIEIEKSASQSASGLTMENNSNVNSAPVLGTIIKAADGCPYKAGDKILFRRYSLDDLKVITENGEETISIVEGSEILAVIRSSD
jgi:co-chaperonin GroES (HSP10)